MNYTQTEGQIERLKQVFSCIGLSARGKTYKAMESLLEEADKITEASQDEPEVLDALKSAAQKVEHL